jgi:hypothetical protein
MKAPHPRPMRQRGAIASPPRSGASPPRDGALPDGWFAGMVNRVEGGPATLRGDAWLRAV